MFLKNLHFSWQFLKRNPLFFLINVVGLVIGITSALFIFIWLSGFVYRTDIPFSSFVLATLGTALLALVTVGREILRVMWSRPVNSLRYE